MTENKNLLEEFTTSIESVVESSMESLTLEKAIELCDNAAKRYDMMNMPSCAAEERQFAEWLRELKELRADCAHCVYMYGNNSMHRYAQEIKVMLRLQERLQSLIKECNEKATAIGEEAKAELDAIRENKES